MTAGPLDATVAGPHTAPAQARAAAAVPWTVVTLQPHDFAAWKTLAVAYKTFYETTLPDAAYQHAWQRLQAEDRIHAWGAKVDGQLVGVAHYLFHSSTWAQDVCYLQDLFVAESARGQGVARALIEQVARTAQARGASRYYWLTHHTNARARRLYDRVAAHHGFVRYDYPLATA